jgi:FtsP/CotA-like multicopper oxidase with cupredoxin domain
MNKRKCLFFLFLLVTVVAWSFAPALAQKINTRDMVLQYHHKVNPTQQKAAAANAAARGLKPGVAAIGPAVLDPGGIPHYFGPYGNWAYSPLPRGPVAVVTLEDGGTGYTNPLVTIEDVYGTGSGAGAATATVDPVTGAITAITGGLGGLDYSAPIVTITDDPSLCGGVAQPVCGTGATATATIGGALTGGIRKFIDRLPGLTSAGANLLVTPNRLGTPGTTDGQYIPLGVPENFATPSLPESDYYVIGLVEYYERMHTDLPPTRHRGYVQLETATNNASSRHIPLTYLDGSPIFYPGTTTQVLAFDYPHFLGPVIVASRDKSVRIKFHNLLPLTANGGDLFIPVDTTVMGAGEGPNMGEMYTQNRATVHLHGNNTVWISDGTTHQWITPAGEITSYPQGVSARNVPDMPDPGPGAMTLFYTNAQSARLMFYHDHAMGITRLNVYAGEAAGYVVTEQVEQDMIDGTNVSGVNINCDVNNVNCAKVLPDIGIPLVFLDKTFVDASTIAAQDPTWNWGTGPIDPVTGKITAVNTGDLWYPHVYMSAQNPWDLTGMNAFGRWHYGPWFIQPTPVCDANGLPVGCIAVGPVPNEYCLPTKPATCVVNGVTDPGVEGVDYDCSASLWEPPCMPGIPNPSMPGEAFMDTPVVNGTAYPYLEVEPKAYRFRILNAANDRFVNLQLYVAADKNSPTTAGASGPATVLCDPTPADPTVCTEVKMVPVTVAPANQYADWPSGIPDPATKGPDWIQIGTEGGFMPEPIVVPSQPIGWNLNPTTFNFGTVNQHSVLLGTAERADVVVDFSAYAGKTLILYNDAPAAFPAGVPTYDYFTGVPDQMDVGGAPTTQPGYGPNTRTVMQIRVANSTPAAPYDLTALKAVFAKGPAAAKRGVFEVSQDPIIIPQAAYNSAYDAIVANPAIPVLHPIAGFPSTAKGQYVQIADAQKTFQPINADGVLQPAVTIPLEFKAMHDEMGGVYDTQFGRMSGMLGLASQTSPIHTLIPYGYSSPPVDIIKGSVAGSQIGVLPDGTQIWRIFHNGVDTHTIHTHLFTSQLINRTGQDGSMLPPDPIELGWKDTFRINPLEVTYIAMRPIIPTPAQVPFQVPNSVRLIDPTMPENAVLIPPPPAGWFDPDGIPIREILNHYVNFGWEYVWHCHILAHEEMDMMHSLAFAIPPEAPTALLATAGSGTSVDLNWTDTSVNETNFTIERATDVDFTLELTAFTVPANATTYNDASVVLGTPYFYRVIASNVVGDTEVYSAPSVGFPIVSADSVPSNTQNITIGAFIPTVPDAPTGVTAVGGIRQATVSFTAPADGGSPITLYTVTALIGGMPTAITATGTTTTIDVTGLANGTTYTFTVTATNGVGTSLPSAPSLPITTPDVPGAPTMILAIGGNGQATVYFDVPATDGGMPITGYTAASNDGITGTGLTSPITVTTLTNGTPYTFTVTATNAVGTSLPSGSSASVTPVGVPGAPTIGNAVAGNAQATVSFAAPASNGGSTILFYTVISNDGIADGITAVGVGSPITVTGLTNGTPYTFKVTATNAIGTSLPSGSSNPPVTPLLPTLPARPTGLAATRPPISQSPPTVILNWTDNSNNEAGFMIQRAGNLGFTNGLVTFPVGPNTTTFTDNTVALNTRYYYRVFAYNGAGNTAYSNTVQVTTRGQLAATPAITGVTPPPAPAGRNRLTINWTYTTNGAPLQRFQIQRSNNGTTGWATIANPGAAATSYTNTGLNPNTTRYYRIRAVNAYGNSPWSNVASGTTLP